MAQAAGGAAAAGAAVAAQQQRLREQEEEERMTSYTEEELSEDWEFKIIRSSLNSFNKPERLKQMLKEESLAGWEMVEKFDDSRVRLKRLASARRQDHQLPPDVNPYRTTYGPGDTRILLIILAVIGLAVLGIIIAIIFAT